MPNLKEHKAPEIYIFQLAQLLAGARKDCGKFQRACLWSELLRSPSIPGIFFAFCHLSLGIHVA
jgi:hypothetical protein